MPENETEDSRVCETCVFWSRQLHSAGTCRFNPPGRFGWPDVSAYGWCGKWQGAETK